MVLIDGTGMWIIRYLRLVVPDSLWLWFHVCHVRVYLVASNTIFEPAAVKLSCLYRFQEYLPTMRLRQRYPGTYLGRPRY